jgi:uncharacterized protein (DUF302 family)
MSFTSGNSGSTGAISAGLTLTCTPATVGIASYRSPHSVEETVSRLREAIRAAGATLFTVIDPSGHARRVGRAPRDTRLLIFGHPATGTAVMAALLAALDLPPKILVWQDDAGVVWASHLDPDWLAARHQLPAPLARPLRAATLLTAQALLP